ncbi:MAG: DUF4843 domain-containing protein [Dysgonamonadaceae bacterium]|jgi:hypothetical protein|nr:DUF4843 domain-containing protein [Dysgonamonadaceae bacterium]
MKKILLVTIIFVGVFTSCDYDTLPTYNDVDRVYFDYAAWVLQELPVQGYTSTTPNQVKILFGYDKVIKADSTIAIKVRVMGSPVATDRPIAAEVIATESSATAGTDVEILPSVIPANEVVGSLYIKLKNTEKLKTNTLLARIRLVPNDYFHVDFTNTRSGSDRTATEFEIYFDAKKEAPGLWVYTASTPNLNTYFGTYSSVKLDAICAATGYTREDFEYDADAAEEYESGVQAYVKKELDTRFPSALTFGLVLQLNYYLVAYKAANGVDLVDENGNIVLNTYTYSSWR